MRVLSIGRRITVSAAALSALGIFLIAPSAPASAATPTTSCSSNHKQDGEVVASNEKNDITAELWYSPVCRYVWAEGLNVQHDDMAGQVEVYNEVTGAFSIANIGSSNDVFTGAINEPVPIPMHACTAMRAIRTGTSAPTSFST
jgi:hypothetical protein